MVVRVAYDDEKLYEVDDKFSELVSEMITEQTDELENIILSKLPGKKIIGIYDLDYNPIIEY